MPQPSQTVPKLLEAIGKARQNAPLAAQAPRLIAACKQQSEAAIEEAIAAGVTHFAENRVQEAQSKWVEIKKRHPQVTLHLIGPLQTNKVGQALKLFDVIQTVDRVKLAEEIAEEIGEATTQFLIQVNTGREPQKAGCAPEDAAGLIDICRDRLKLNVVGLMCVPPADDHPAPHFAFLYKLAREKNLPELSMGMSGDFETAIRFGATYVRIGRAVFGQRA